MSIILTVNNSMRLVIFCLSMMLSLTVAATQQRNASAKYQFKKLHPCPVTGKRSGTCKGYVIDHVRALACGGLDAPSNMQWQTIAEAKAKDRWERNECSVPYSLND